jgi:hypothetical protein
MELIDLSVWHWQIIDGQEPDSWIMTQGRRACINGTGDYPMFMLDEDTTGAKCSPVVSVPHIEPQLFAAVPAVPEPSTWALMVGSLVVCRLWSVRKRANRITQKRGPHDYK